MRRFNLLVIIFFVLFLVGCKKYVNYTFEPNGGTSCLDMSLEENETNLYESKLPKPTKAEHIFGGWYIDSSLTYPYNGYNHGETNQIKLYAKWIPNNPNYKVEHYQEALAGNYVLQDTDYINGQFDNMVYAVKKQYTGFSENEDHPNRIISGRVEAEGNLVLRVYYSRNIYTISIDENGGVGVSDISAKFQSPLSVPTLTRSGFIFNGWDKYFPTTMPAENMTIKASWLEILPVAVNFNSMGGSIVETQSVIVGNKAVQPENPTKMGYEFVSWQYWDLNPQMNLFDYNFNTIILNQVNLYAKWKPAINNYKVEYYQENVEDNNYTLFETVDLTALTEATVNALIKEYSGFSENVLHLNRNINGAVLADGSLVLRVYYTRNIYNIIINENGGNEVSDLNLKYGTVVNSLPLLTKLGYIHDGYDVDLPFTVGTNDISATAKYNPDLVIYKVEHYQENANDDDYVLVETQSLTGYTESEVSAVVKNYLGFSENTIHSSRIVQGTVLADGSLLLKVYYQRNLFTASFNVDGGSEISQVTKKFGSTIDKPTDPTKVGHDFVNWYPTSSSDQPYVFTTMPNNNFTIFAKWSKNYYIITFESNANISITSLSALYDETIIAPDDPIRTGFEFIGWYTETELINKYVFNKMPGYHFTLYAKWEGLPSTLNFNSNGGTNVNSINANAGTQIEKPLPTKLGFDFDDWYTNENCTVLFDNWFMPYGTNTLYAKWDAKTYTILFNSNGGSEVNSLNAKYQSAITLPKPTKPQFIFDDWYLDEDLTVKFTATTMPLHGAELFAKWIEQELENQISYVLKQSVGSGISLEGYVYSKISQPYAGFYIYDSTGTIFILANQDLVNIGDLISLDGFLEVNGVINGVSNLTILSSDNVIQQPLEILLDEVNQIEINIFNLGKYLSAEGVIIFENNYYYLLDINTLNKYKINHRFYALVSNYTGDYVQANFVLANYSSSWELGIVQLDVISLTVEQMLSASETWLMMEYNNKNYYSEDYFSILEYDIFNFASITFNPTGDNAQLYNPFAQQFVEVETQTTISFAVTLTIQNQTSTITIDINLKPKTPSLIDDVISAVDEDYYIIKGIVVMSFEENQYLVKDASGSIYVFGENLNISIGEEVILKIFKTSYLNMIQGSNAVLIDILSESNPLNNPAEVMTFEELILMDKTNAQFYGKYIETRGFIKFSDEIDFHGAFLEKNNQKIRIIPINYNAFESLFEFEGMEIIFRGYTVQLNENEWMFYYVGTREDIKIPEYTDQELVSILQTLFTYQYINRTFRPMESFDLYSSHYILGADISWSFASNCEQYYDFNKKAFKLVFEPVPISINITIKKNDIILNFTYNTTLEPLDTANFYEAENGEYLFVEGLVVYRHPDFLYLLSNDELIYVRIYDLDIYKGDYVILYGRKQIDNDTYGASYLSREWYSEYSCLIGILSRDNPVNIPKDILSVYEVNEFDPNSLYQTKYIETTGYLHELNNRFELNRGNEKIIITPSDEYTSHKLKQYKDTFITICLYLDEYNESSNLWYMIYTGMASEISAIDLAVNNNILNIVQEDLMNLYELREFRCNDLIPLPTQHNQLDVQYSFSTSGDNEHIIDTTTGMIQNVNEVKLVDLIVTATIDGNDYEIRLTITIIPSEIIVNPDVITISEVKQSPSNQLSKFRAQVIGYSPMGSTTCVLLEDHTGIIYININEYYYYLNIVIGNTYEVSGYMTNVRGRNEVNVVTFNYYLQGSASKTFEQAEFEEIISLDYRNDLNFGKPVSITGKLEMANWGEFYLTNGYEKVRLFGNWNVEYDLYNLNNYDVTINGFIYGYTDNNMLSMMLVYYYETAPVIINQYSDEEIVNFIENVIVGELHNKVYYPYDNISLWTYFPIFSNAIIEYTLIDGFDYINFSSSYFYTSFVETDQIIKIEVSIGHGSYQKIIILESILKGFTLNNYEDLFVDNNNTDTINLKATVLLSEFNFHYFLINGNIYYIEQYFNTYIQANDTVILTGKKYKIDGKVDYTFEISAFSTNDQPEEFNYEAQMIDMDYLVSNSGEILPYYIIYGYLKYDDINNCYYIQWAEGGYRIYLRGSFHNVMPTSLNYKMEPWELEKYIDEYVYMKVLFPNIKIFGEHYLVDFRGFSDEIWISDYTIEQRLDISLAKLQLKYGSNTIYSGDYISLPWGDSIHEVTFTYSLQNPEDSDYFNLYYMSAKMVSTPITINLVVEAIYDDENSITSTIEVTILPYPLSTIREVLWGLTGQKYSTEGVVQHFGEYWIILKDDTSIIYAETRLTFDYMENLIQVGDKIQIIGERDTYWGNDFVPIIEFDDVKFISANNLVDKIPSVYTFNDILNIDYLNPDSFTKYIRITGKIISIGNYWYPAYALEDENGTMYYLSLEGQVDNDFNDLMSLYSGETLTIDGYLIGFAYIYSPFDWYLKFDSIVFVPN